MYDVWLVCGWYVCVCVWVCVFQCVYVCAREVWVMYDGDATV